jgi:hypothetical protein
VVAEVAAVVEEVVFAVAGFAVVASGGGFRGRGRGFGWGGAAT